MGALSGYLVIDLTDEKGMFCTKLLSEMGAEVIRLELEEKAEQDRLRELIKKADALVETFPPGYLTSLGLGYTYLRKINPGLIMVSITHFGQSGGYQDYESCDLVTQALGGWLSVTGEPQLPLKLFGNQAYFTASLFAANGILLALWHRHATGWGQYIDISVMECVAATLDHALVNYYYEGIVSGRQGNRHWNNAFCILPCKDGFILLSLFQYWEILVHWLESEGMAADLTGEKWRDKETRNKGIDHIVKVLEDWTLTHIVSDLVEKGQLMHFPWAKVTSIPKRGN